MKDRRFAHKARLKNCFRQAQREGKCRTNCTTVRLYARVQQQARKTKLQKEHCQASATTLRKAGESIQCNNGSNDRTTILPHCASWAQKALLKKYAIHDFDRRVVREIVEQTVALSRCIQAFGKRIGQQSVTWNAAKFLRRLRSKLHKQLANSNVAARLSLKHNREQGARRSEHP